MLLLKHKVCFILINALLYQPWGFPSSDCLGFEISWDPWGSDDEIEFKIKRDLPVS